MSDQRKTALSLITEYVLDDVQITTPELVYRIRVSLADEHGYTYEVWRSDDWIGTPEDWELVNAEQEVLRTLADLVGDRMREKFG